MGHFIADTQRLWPAGIIPYEMDESFSHASDATDPESALSYIQRAIQEWNDKTIVQLVPRAAQEDYVTFAPTDEVSQSEYVGRNGGPQLVLINLQRARRLGAAVGGSALGVIVHEIGHAAGLLHEHQRRDRDDYITIAWDNIAADRTCGFCVRAEDVSCNHCELHPGIPVGPYDYDSVMHYFVKQGAIDSARPTIVPRLAGASAANPTTRNIGRSDGLSAGDIAAIAAVYAGRSPRTV